MAKLIKYTQRTFNNIQISSGPESGYYYNISNISDLPSGAMVIGFSAQTLDSGVFVELRNGTPPKIFLRCATSRTVTVALTIFYYVP